DGSGNVFVADSANHTIRKGAPVVAPQSVTLTAENGTEYTGAGGMVTSRVRVIYTGQTPSAIGVTVVLPAGWTFSSFSGESAAAAPAVGDNTLEWAFSS